MMITLGQLDQLLQIASENEHIEFKEAKKLFDSDKLCEYCIALANERGGRLILGVTNRRPRRVVGTHAFPDLQATREWLFASLGMRIETQELMHHDGRLVVFDIPSRPLGTPLEYRGRYLMRVGEMLVSMSPDRLQQILAELQSDSSSEGVRGTSLSDVDDLAIQEFRSRWTRKARNSRLAHLSIEQLLHDAGLWSDGSLNVAGLVLVGKATALAKYLPQAEVVFEYRSRESATSYQQRLEFRQGFYSMYNDLWNAINLRNDRQSYQDGLFRLEIPTFDESVVREALLNAIAHRDYRLVGSVFVRQFPRRLEIVSPGGFPAGINPANVLDRQNPRNRRMAEAFSLSGLVERSGQGMNRMFEESIKAREAPAGLCWDGCISSQRDITWRSATSSIRSVLGEGWSRKTRILRDPGLSAARFCASSGACSRRSESSGDKAG